MLLHAFPLMSVSSLREFPENCVYTDTAESTVDRFINPNKLRESETERA
jgi:hypothetical protein